jgi:outer membrane protein assembly factor BamB
VAAVLDSGSLKTVSAQGRPLWTYASQGRLTPFLTRSPEGHCYIGRTNGEFIAVNRVGRELWRGNLRAPLSGPAVLGWDGRLFVPGGTWIHCFTAAGRLLWRRQLGLPPVIPPVPDQDGGVILVLANAAALRLGPFGEAQSLYLSALPRAVVPLGSPGNGGRLLILYENGGMELADFRSADFSRGPRPLPRLEERPLAAAGWGLDAAVLLESGRILALKGLTGEPLWSADSLVAVPGRNEPHPALVWDERGIYAFSAAGASGFTRAGGLLWHLDLQDTSSLPGFGDDGILYSGGADWILNAYKLEERVRRLPYAMYGPAPEGNYGAGSPPPSSWTGNPMRWEESVLEEQLRTIRGDLLQGRVGERELEYTAFLMETIGAGGDPESSRRRPLVQISHRVRSLELLALMGSRDTVPFLARIFRDDPEPAVRTAAALAIGAIGQDKQGAALDAFAGAVFSLREEQVMTAVAFAAGALGRFSGPPLNGTGIQILSVLSGPDRPNQVRALAKRELESLIK